ncbi:hypothetical protein [Rhodococcus sp. NPDC127528]|uniref:hypothetical protein n=1 Tax=unclassified Rhodococcus (in: high G+C Gram-positive bacteria) TaxID=192944 RepID=UPI00364355D8
MIRERSLGLAACSAIAAAVLGVVGSIAIGTVAGGVVWVLVGGGAAAYLLAVRRRTRAAENSVIATRADEQNARYLEGDASGLYSDHSPTDLDGPERS